VLAISDKKYYATPQKDDCMSYPFVLVERDSIKHWIYGSSIYTFDESKEHRRLSIGDNFYNLFIAESLDEEIQDGDFTGCFKTRPIVVKINYNDGYRAIRLKSTKYPQTRFEFATLDSFSNLKQIEVDSAGATLSIHQSYMEEAADFDVRISNFGGSHIDGEVHNIKLTAL
jgi:hypothetical protein